MGDVFRIVHRKATNPYESINDWYKNLSQSHLSFIYRHQEVVKDIHESGRNGVIILCATST
jgi:hypothetical protein